MEVKDYYDKKDKEVLVGIEDVLGEALTGEGRDDAWLSHWKKRMDSRSSFLKMERKRQLRELGEN